MKLKLLKLVNNIKIFFKLDVIDKILFFEAFILTGVMRVAILYIPINKLKPLMGRYTNESPLDITSEEFIKAKRIGSVLRKVVKYTPWQSKCLVQAITAQMMLKRRKVYGTIYLGVNKDDKYNLSAHAWLRCGQYIITGGYEAPMFKQVAKFTNYEFNKSLKRG